MENKKIILDGKNILVTGGSLGIGFAATLECAKAGANITICARNITEVDSAVIKIKKMYPSVKINGISADVTNLEQVENAINLIEDSYGKLNGVIHSAGVYGPIGKITDVNPESWFDAIRINLFGTFLVSRQSIMRMQKNGVRGKIALFSGGGAASPFPNFTSYASSKVGVVRFSESVALEFLDDHISINSIAPGFVATRLHEQTLAAGPRLAGKNFYDQTTEKITNRSAVPPEVGGICAAFLMSDASDGINGKFIAAPYDDYQSWCKKIDFISHTDLFTLR
jgi:3-oxoacyl-[acyl-carrier protein] reductase